MDPKPYRDMFNAASWREVVLHKLRYGAVQHIRPEAIANGARADVEIVGHLGEMMLIRMVHDVWSDEPQSVSVEYPSDWWQAVKARWYPRWALRRWPVVMTRKLMEARTIYPALSPRNPEHASVVKLRVIDPEQDSL